MTIVGAGGWARGVWRAGRACPDPDSDRNTHLDANVDPGAVCRQASQRRLRTEFSAPTSYPKITNTNGYNTYVGNNMWAAGGSGMTQTLTAG